MSIKNEKGFSLLEIMTVLIILGLLALIVTPLIMNTVRDSKKKLYNTQLDNVKDAARAYMVDKDLDDNSSMDITFKELKQSGFLKKNVTNPDTGEDYNDCTIVRVTRNNYLYDYQIVESSTSSC